MKLVSGVGEKPLWSQLYDELVERIQNGTYKEGEMLPTEMEVMDEFGVSRMTVRQAMNKLISDDFIKRMRGKGTVVLKKDYTIGTTLKSTFNGISEKNNHKNRKVISVTYCKPSKKVAEFFNIDLNKDVLRIVRQNVIEGKIVSIHDTYLNPIVPLDDKEDFNGSLYEKLKSINFVITSINEKISCSLMDESQKLLFNISCDEAIMCRERRGYSNERGVEYTYSMYLSTGYELVIDLM
ncbi:MAG: GntR family transcriptional regulator [Clostridium sp.]|uniref:GntR family transcriptional regulator n=1 Tax=Clostridium sp. TaxID=1506 RepID=UPI00290A453E|nr:GntR family transcriptional regulator [Clostridium sp.]MDU4937732.1 GntR family transcriptional regulator [Clostridium sp.]